MTGTPTTNWGFPTYDGTEPGSLKTVSNAQANAAETAMNNASKGFYLRYTTKALMLANVTASAGQHANVYADPIAANNGDYTWSGTAWVLSNANPAIVVRRSTTAVAGGANVWQQLATTAWWTQDLNVGFAVFNGTIVVPITAWYRLGAGITFNPAPTGLILMVTKNNSSANETGNILRFSTSAAAGELGAYTQKLVKLTAGDVLRLQIFPTSTWTWSTDPDDGVFSLELAYV